MKFRPYCKLDELAGSSERYALDVVAIEQDGGRFLAIATDARVLAVLELDVTPCREAHVPAEAWRLAREAAERADREDVAECGPEVAGLAEAEITLGSGEFLEVQGPRGPLRFLQPEGEFPRWRGLIPKREDSAQLTLNAELLAKLQRAFGASAVRLYLPSSNVDPMRVEPVGGAPGVGVLMPAQVEGECEEFCVQADRGAPGEARSTGAAVERGEGGALKPPAFSARGDGWWCCTVCGALTRTTAEPCSSAWHVRRVAELEEIRAARCSPTEPRPREAALEAPPDASGPGTGGATRGAPLPLRQELQREYGVDDAEAWRMQEAIRRDREGRAEP